MGAHGRLPAAGARLLPAPEQRGGAGLCAAHRGRAGQQPGVLCRGRVSAADRRGQAHGVHHLAVSGH